MGGTFESRARQQRTSTPVGRILTAIALILGPLLWCVGLFMRVHAVESAGFTAEEIEQFAAEPFAVREQLAAYVADPSLVIAAYGIFLAGSILLILTIAVLANSAARRSPSLAVVGGSLVIAGLVARAYFAGVEQVAFQLVETQGLDAAATTVLDAYVNLSYGPLRVPVIAAFGQYLGVPLLAASLYRAKVFGGARVLIFLWWGTVWGGVLKTAGWWDVVSGAALFVVLAVLAVDFARHGESSPRRGRGPLSW